MIKITTNVKTKLKSFKLAKIKKATMQNVCISQG